MIKKFSVTNYFMENPDLLHYAVKWFFYIFGKTYWVTFENWTRKKYVHFSKTGREVYSSVFGGNYIIVGLCTIAVI